MTVYNVTKTFNKGFVNALKAYLNCDKLDIRYSDWLNDVNIFIYDTCTEVMRNKKELCLKQVKRYVQQFKNDKDFKTCPAIDHNGFRNKHNAKKDSKITEGTIYNPRLILKAYAFEENYYKLLGLNKDEQAPQIVLFVIEDKQIKSVKFIPRTLVCNYKPFNNEYYLNRIRDTEDVITDYNLAPVYKLVNLFKGIF